MSAYSDQVIADGAIAYWRLNELSGTTAVDSIGGFNGTISGGVTLGQPGAIVDGDKAMTFDGSTGKIVTGNVVFPAAYTVEGWINTTAMSTIPWFSTRTPSNVSPEIFMGTTGGNPYISIVGDGVLNPALSLAIGQWRYVVVTVTATQLTLYVDGTQVAQTTGTSPAVTKAVGIGWDGLGNLKWSGSLDDVAIYPTALSATQVSNHFKAASIAISPIPKLIGIDTRELLIPSQVYCIPVSTSLLAWQSPSGSNLLISNNNSLYYPLSASQPNEVKNASALGMFIKTTSFDTTVIAK